MSKVTLTRVVSSAGKVKGLTVLFTDDDGRKVLLSFDPLYHVETIGSVKVETYHANTKCPVIRDVETGRSERSGPTARVIAELANALTDLRD